MSMLISHLHALTRMKDYDRAVIVTSDGNFSSLVSYLLEQNKLEMVLIPHVKTCSGLLRAVVKGNIR